MKKLILTVCSLILSSALLYAENLSEIFSSNDALTNIFVNPLGLDDPIDCNDIESVITCAERMGLNYKVMNLGNYGKVLSIDPNDFNIGGVSIERLMILIQEGANAIFIQSAPDDNYQRMSDYLDDLLAEYNSDSNPSNNGNENCKIFMLNDKYGIAVGAIERQKVALAILMDMKNLTGFLTLYPAIVGNN